MPESWFQVCPETEENANTSQMCSSIRGCFKQRQQITDIVKKKSLQCYVYAKFFEIKWSFCIYLSTPLQIVTLIRIFE